MSSECNGKITKYEYDAAGRLVKEGKRSYSYSWLDKVSSVKENGVEVASFTYHMDGQIATAKANGRQENFLWDNLALISRNETEYVNEPYVTGGNPILADEDVLFNDLLGTTIGIRSGKEYRETGMTAFGETDEKSAMFTGKPYIGELGYAFLFRNYRPGLGKWQTSDPLGYPDGWNNFAYCNNELILAFDFLGALTTFYPNGNPYTKQEQRNHATHIHNNKTCETYDLYEASFQEGFNVTYTTIQTAAGAVLDWAKNFLTQIQVAAVTAGTYAVYSPTPVDDGAIVIIIAATTLSKESLIPYLESHMSDTFSRVVIDSYERATKQLTNWKKIKTVHSVEE